MSCKNNCSCGHKNDKFTRSWCPGSRSCLNTQMLQRNCAGPLELTGEDDIGDRPCCGGLKKCKAEYGLRSWCSSTGKCPGNSNQTFDYFTKAPHPFRDYSDVPVYKPEYIKGLKNIKENFCADGKTNFEGVL